MEGFFTIGSIAGTHGLKGMLRVFPLTDDPKRFSLLKEVWVEKGQIKELYKIKDVAYHKKFVLLLLEGIADINEAETLKGGTILIPEKDALPLGADEYYQRDLYGLTVVTETGEHLGTLTEIYSTGANDVYAVTKEGEKQELLLPAIKQCILSVDLGEKKMVVKVLEGLR